MSFDCHEEKIKIVKNAYDLWDSKGEYSVSGSIRVVLNVIIHFYF